MKVGDLVMFTDTGTYAKWFYGQLAVIESYTAEGSDGKAHCGVRWLQPVPYHDKVTSKSNFPAARFKVMASA